MDDPTRKKKEKLTQQSHEVWLDCCSFRKAWMADCTSFLASSWMPGLPGSYAQKMSKKIGTGTPATCPTLTHHKFDGGHVRSIQLWTTHQCCGLHTHFNLCIIAQHPDSSELFENPVLLSCGIQREIATVAFAGSFLLQGPFAGNIIRQEMCSRGTFVAHVCLDTLSRAFPHSLMKWATCGNFMGFGNAA